MTTIKTTDQAATLPVGSVVRDQHDEVAIRRKAGWDFNGYTATTSELMDHGPLTVLHDPPQPAPAGVIDREALVSAVRAVERRRALISDVDLPDAYTDAALAFLDTRTVAQVKAEALREAAAIANYGDTQRWLNYRADELEREDKR